MKALRFENGALNVKDLAIPADDAGGAFASLVAEYAIGLDEGREPAAAWDTATRRLGAEPA